MNSHHCCQKTRGGGGHVRQPASRWRRARKVAGWLIPGAVLALLPKCPMCLAAYVALGTGLTLSYASAHVLMCTLTWLCVSVLAFCVMGRMIKSFRRKHPLNLQSTSSSR